MTHLDTTTGITSATVTIAAEVVAVATIEVVEAVKIVEIEIVVGMETVTTGAAAETISRRMAFATDNVVGIQTRRVTDLTESTVGGHLHEIGREMMLKLVLNLRLRRGREKMILMSRSRRLPRRKRLSQRRPWRQHDLIGSKNF